MEFVETLDTHHQIVSRGGSKVNADEFVDYYTSVGFCVQSDDYFAIIINNAWNLSGNAITY